MPGTTIPFVPHYVPAQPTKETLDWAELPIIDISKASTAEGRAELAPIARDAMHTFGFIVVLNHGLTLAQNERIFDIADVPFTQVPDDEQKQFSGINEESGMFEGYKPRQYWTIDNGVRDQVEYYSFFGQDRHPKALAPFLPEIHAFARNNHLNILHPILRLLALGLELPEETFVDIHKFDEDAVRFPRFMKYHPRSEEDEVRAKNVWIKGHTDIGTVTMLWSQPVAALQVKCSDGQWRWVKPVENGIVVNVGDSMEMLSGGFYKAAIHRVVQPPRDQHGFTRLGVFYFAMCDEDIKLRPYLNSPVLQKQEVRRRIDDEHAPTMKEWRKGRTKMVGSTVMSRKDAFVEEQVISGVVVKHYH